MQIMIKRVSSAYIKFPRTVGYFSTFLRTAMNCCASSELRQPRHIQKPHIVVLGCGWAGYHFVNTLHKDKYKVSVVSPKNYFLFTPFLPSVLSGALEIQSCIQPLRPVTLNANTNFHMAECLSVNTDEKSVTLSDVESGKPFQLHYDFLVLGVGSQPTTFGIPGVEKYAFFLKELEHALAIRKRILKILELASLPSTNDEEKKGLLHFVIVGGGPTGVEAAGEISDLCREEIPKLYPQLSPFIRITIVEGLPKLLPTFSENVSNYVGEFFRESLKISVLNNHLVTSITATHVNLRSLSTFCGDSCESALRYGIVIWASGVAKVPLISKIIDSIPSQRGNRGLIVDSRNRVQGVDSVYAIGDCALVKPHALADSADVLFEAAEATGGASSLWIVEKSYQLKLKYPQVELSNCRVLSNPNAQRLSKTQFLDLLSSIDKSFVPPSATAQNARQQGVYLGSIFNSHNSEKSLLEAPSFIAVWRGSMAYIGNFSAVASSPKFDMKGCYGSFFLWKVAYTTLLITWKSKIVCNFNWIITSLFGRNTGLVRD